jgi:hypothetical protein
MLLDEAPDLSISKYTPIKAISKGKAMLYESIKDDDDDSELSIDSIKDSTKSISQNRLVNPNNSIEHSLNTSDFKTKLFMRQSSIQGLNVE